MSIGENNENLLFYPSAYCIIDKKIEREVNDYDHNQRALRGPRPS